MIVKDPATMSDVDLATTGYGQGIAITPIQILSFVLDEINDNHISKEEGLVIIDNFVRRIIVTGA